MSRKKRQSSRGSRERKYQVDTLGLSSMQLSAAPASGDETRPAGSSVNSSAEWFSPELIRHLIDRIKEI